MNPQGRWERYPRDLEGAWHAIDDLRDVIGELVDERDIRNVRRLSAWQIMGIAAAAVSAFAVTCSVILTLVPRP